MQQLADMICKSRASVSKYETGEITVDIQTLYDIGEALHIPLTHLTDYQPKSDTIPGNPRDNQEKNSFFSRPRI
ncbi:MAG: helix-turn-helix transcriptional regulator [Dakarella massiliensis]